MHTLRTLLAGGALAAFVLADATAADTVPPAAHGLFATREQALAAFQAMPQGQLEAVFLHCDRVARHQMLDFTQGAHCAMASDALLQRRFGGDFRALLAWWLEQREGDR